MRARLATVGVGALLAGMTLVSRASAQGMDPTSAPAPLAAATPSPLAQAGDWRSGDPVPSGYHQVRRVSGGLIGGGVALFTGLYVLTALGSWFGGYQLLIPVLGPIISIPMWVSDVSVAGDALLVVDALGQAAGVAMMIVGGLGRTVLVRDDAGAPRLELRPMVGMGATSTGHGMGLRLHF